MVRLTLIWGVLLLTGIFIVDIYAKPPMSAPVQSKTYQATESSNTTMKTSSIATSHPSSNETTPTTHTTSSTTHMPSNTTSHSPFNTTTHPVTTIPVLPTKPSPPSSGNYTVKDAKETCIIADMGLALEMDNSTTETEAREAKGKWYFNVNPKTTHANGTCGESKANLFLEFPEGSIHFLFVKESKIYYIDEVSVNFSRNSAEHWTGTARNLKLLSTDIGYSVKCKNTPIVKLASNLQLTMADVKLQAFDIHSGALGKEKVCYPDRNKLLIPVGVALAVVGLILIILLVFLLTRRRRSSEYERL